MDIEKMYTNYLRSNAHYSVQNKSVHRSDSRKETPDKNPRKRRRKNNGDQDGYDEGDYALVSVGSLLAFLNTFLNDLTPAAPTSTQDDNENIENTPPVHRANQAAYSSAANAYAHNQSINKTQHTNNTAQNSGNLDDSDITLIHGLIKDLSQLKDNGLEHLRIGRDGTFLKCIAVAVQEHMSV